MIEMTPQEEFDAFLGRVLADARVLGVVLSGSRAREGMATARSDFDVYVVSGDGTEGVAAEARRDARLDVSVMPLAEFRTHASPGSPTEWNRYAFTHAQVLKDATGGLITELVAAKGRLSPSEAAAVAPAALGAFLNAVYRCVKNAGNGDATAARLDAAEAVPCHLTYVFALHQRVRPYNKYLAWELDRHPLSHPEWSRPRLLGLLGEALSPAAAPAVRRLLADLEPHARSAGHGPVLDSWGDDLRLMLGGGAGEPATPPW
ncbi:hypothetical protein ABGB17_24965 [Sphaerisporangium sp. B11E5]|uniref:hypothetical protein n=1 Tax=Sphaerisporangium sp. B11E5 TaxID=3153563 RepID=UPI00325ECC93